MRISHRYWPLWLCLSIGIIAISIYGLTDHNSSPGPNNSLYGQNSKLYVKAFPTTKNSSWMPVTELNLLNAPTTPGEKSIWEPNKTRITSHLWEVTKHPNRAPSDRELRDAYQLYNQTYQHALEANWTDPAEAREDGYAPIGNGMNDLHWYNNALFLDNATNNPEKPETLLYKRNESTTRFLGVMYESSSVTEPLNPPGGPTIRPHVHIWEEHWCFKQNVLRLQRPPCPQNWPKHRTSVQMYHIWFVEDKQGGPFATSMNLLASGKFDEAPHKLNQSEFNDAVLANQ